MTTPPQVLNSSQHNSNNEDDWFKKSENYPTEPDDNDTSSVRTDSTTVPAANLPRRVTISRCRTAMADHIRQLAESVILSLPTRLCLNDETVFYPRLSFVQSLAQSIRLANRSNATTEQHYTNLVYQYRSFAGAVPSAHLDANLLELAGLINSFQAAVLAEIVASILDRESNKVPPPAAIRGGSHTESLSDITAEHSYHLPVEAPIQVAAAARVLLVDNHQNMAELHGNIEDRMSDGVQSGIVGSSVGYHLSEVTYPLTESTGSARSGSTAHGAN